MSEELEDSLGEATPPALSPSALNPAGSTANSPDTDALANTENEEGEGWSDVDENGFWGSNDGTGGGEDDFQAFEENGE